MASRKSLAPTHPEGWHDRAKKAASELNMDGANIHANVRGGGGPGPKNAGGGGKAKGCGPNYANDYDTTPAGYKAGRK